MRIRNPIALPTQREKFVLSGPGNAGGPAVRARWLTIAGEIDTVLNWNIAHGACKLTVKS